VEGDRIAAVGPGLAAPDAPVIDASGLLVAPGFIDVHSHSDFFYLDVPSAESKVRQGVTTEVVGMCGFSPAPVGGEARRLLLEKMATALGARLSARWRGFGEFLDRLRALPLSVNVVPFVGHGAVRLAVVGPDARPASGDEMARMEALVGEAMDAGAFGLSTGLVYPPGVYAGTDEVVALARVVAARGGFYFTHIRGEAGTLEEAVAEAIEIGERSGAPVEVAHLKAAGRDHWPRLDRALARIEGARARGVDVTADVYPYTAGSTIMVNLLPEWALDGGVEALLQRLADPAVCRRLVEERMRPDGRWETPSGAVAWDEVQVATCSRPALEGLTLQEIAAREGRTGAEAMLDLLRRERGDVSMIRFNQSEDNVMKVLAHPAVMVGSDSIALTAGPGPHPGKPHPRTYGTFPRVLGRYVREKQLLTWEAAIHKMTGMAAARLGLRERGLVQPGLLADLAIVDPATVADAATYRDPHRHAVGIPWVIVNGRVVVERGEPRPQAAGRVLR
jgi:N-acyl-D-aspartate/D-glutamate deacylase